MPKAPKSAASSKQKRKPSDRGPALGPNAPISHLSMPLNAEELTLPELAAFLLRYLRSFDFCDRVTKNGVTRVPIANMVRYFCKLPKPLKDATIARMLQHAKWDILGREKGSGQNWKIRDEKKANLTNWDHGNLSTQGYQLNIERLSKSHLNISSIPFEHLAIDVEFMPEGDDTLYLTRCIRYALRSPGIYVYPQDFGRLIHITGGPVVVTLDHHDDAAAKRWVQAKPKPVASTEPSTEPAIDDRDNEPTTEIYDENYALGLLGQKAVPEIDLERFEEVDASIIGDFGDSISAQVGLFHNMASQDLGLPSDIHESFELEPLFGAGSTGAGISDRW